jgi:hypothetical protein
LSFLVSAVFLAALLIACGPELNVQRAPSGQDVQFEEVEPGQCLWREIPEHPVWESVRVVDCAGDRWQVQLLNRFTIDAAGPYPGEGFMLDQARAHCGAGWTESLPPRDWQWERGDRVVVCLKHRDPAAAPAGTAGAP